MNKKKLIIFIGILFFVICFITILIFSFKNSKKGINVMPVKNVEESIFNKYKNLGYEIVSDKIVFCNQSMNCIYDVFKSCTRSDFLMFSKTDNTGYIISSLGFVNNSCSVKMINGSNHKDIKNCLVDKIYLNNKFIDNFLENKKYLEFCK